jgi:catechol 2,3-dioxygenase-like lactoylglutathione lyase family enzyme
MEYGPESYGWTYFLGGLKEMADITKALHAGISVYDMEKAIQWYKDNLEFEVIKDDYVKPLKARLVFIRNKAFEIELFQYDEPKEIPEERKTPNSDLQTVGTKHIAFEVANMETLKEKFLKNNVDIAHEVTMEGNTVMFIRDNSGVLIELIQNNG